MCYCGYSWPGITIHIKQSIESYNFTYKNLYCFLVTQQVKTKCLKNAKPLKMVTVFSTHLLISALFFSILYPGHVEVLTFIPTYQIFPWSWFLVCTTPCAISVFLCIIGEIIILPKPSPMYPFLSPFLYPLNEIDLSPMLDCNAAMWLEFFGGWGTNHLPDKDMETY